MRTIVGPGGLTIAQCHNVLDRLINGVHAGVENAETTTYDPRQCAFELCEEWFTPDSSHPTKKFCSRRCATLGTPRGPYKLKHKPKQPGST